MSSCDGAAAPVQGRVEGSAVLPAAPDDAQPGAGQTLGASGGPVGIAVTRTDVLLGVFGGGQNSASVDSMRSSRLMLIHAPRAACQWRPRSLPAESNRARRKSVQPTTTGICCCSVRTSCEARQDGSVNLVRSSGFSVVFYDRDPPRYVTIPGLRQA
jgi:hypothetical protein